MVGTMKLFGFVLAVLPAIALTQEQCNNGRVFESCGPACPLTCDNYQNPPSFCTLQCVEGCFCPPGSDLVQLNGSCVERRDCPGTGGTTTTTTLAPPPSPTCTNGRLYSDCGTACPLSCKYPEQRPCIRICLQGCFCPDELLEYNDGCVPRSDCPAPATTTIGSTTPTTTIGSTTPTTQPGPVCTHGMMFTNCGTACPVTCENMNGPGPPMFCPLICLQGCFCPTGLVEYGDSCYRPEDCPVTTTTAVVTAPTLPTMPFCPDTMIYTSCGSSCHMTCENYGQLIACIAECFDGCVCPIGTVLDNGRCINPQECPVSTTRPTTEIPTTAITPTCGDGMEYRNCGPVCRQTCSTAFNPCFSLRCAPGCFCPVGQFEHEGGCVEQCPMVSTIRPTTEIPTTPTCRADMEYRNCGPVCRETCTPALNACFSLRCAAGCFCPVGQFEHEGRCVERCPMATEVTPTPPDEPCDESDPHCPAGHVCLDGMCVNWPCHDVTCPPKHSCLNGTCIYNPCYLVDCLPHQYCQNGTCINYTCANYRGCRADQQCEMATVGCGPNDRFCSRYPQCEDAPYVPCGRDAFLSCDSEWTYCLQQNKTRRADCVASCFSQNGNCGDDSVCITSPGERPRLHCVDNDDLTGECSPGMVMHGCGNACEMTCEQHILGLPRVCPAVCGPAECGCPSGLALYRDRCVDPKLCYVLVKYPPPINPLPRVDPNTVLLSLHTRGMTPETFEQYRTEFLLAIEMALTQQGHRVRATVHGVHYNDGLLQIVIELTGSGASPESSEQLAMTLRRHSHLLGLTIEGVGHVEIDYINKDIEDPESSQELSKSAIIGIAVSSAVAGLAIIVAWIAVVMCCCIIRGSNNDRSNLPPQEYKDKRAFENPYIMKEKDPEKGKMILESLNN